MQGKPGSLARSDLLDSRPGACPNMTTPAEMTHEDVLRVKLRVLMREHRDLDDAITALEDSRRPDQLTLRRLKKRKLSLKDQIARIEDELTPDIIA